MNQARAAGNGLARAAANGHPAGGRYKWVALSNTTLSMTMATIDASIVIILSLIHISEPTRPY